ncbi:MAG: nucleoside deaminase [Nitrospinota bacterium]
MREPHERFMKIAIEEARKAMDAGEQPFAAVIVRDGEVLGRGHNRQNSTFDATAHGETFVIRETTVKHKLQKLTGCTLYSTCEPCAMCAGATLNAGISTLVLGARLAKMTRFTGEQFSPGEYKGGVFNFHEYTVERLVEMMGADLEIVTGILEAECEDIYRNSKVRLTL